MSHVSPHTVQRVLKSETRLVRTQRTTSTPGDNQRTTAGLFRTGTDVARDVACQPLRDPTGAPNTLSTRLSSHSQTIHPSTPPRLPRAKPIARMFQTQRPAPKFSARARPRRQRDAYAGLPGREAPLSLRERDAVEGAGASLARRDFSAKTPMFMLPNSSCIVFDWSALESP